MAGKKRASKWKINPYILIPIVLAIGILGFLFLQREKPSQIKNNYEENKASTIKAVNNNVGSVSPTWLPYKEPAKYSPKQALSENGYAVIPELHIKFKVDDNLSDLTYTFYAFEHPGYQNYEFKTSFVYISTQSLSKLSPYCSSDHAAIGVMERSLETPIGKASGPSSENVKKIGDYYYSFLRPQALCIDPDKEGTTLQLQQIKALQAAFQTMEVVQ